MKSLAACKLVGAQTGPKSKLQLRKGAGVHNTMVQKDTGVKQHQHLDVQSSSLPGNIIRSVVGPVWVLVLRPYLGPSDTWLQWSVMSQAWGP